MADRDKNRGSPDEAETTAEHSDEKKEPERFDEKEWKEKRKRYKEYVEAAVKKHWRGGEDHVSYTPWLVIRYAAGDFGLRPIPSGIAHWKSPDIWVESSDPNGNAVAGEQNFVHVRIFNLGMARAIPVKIDFFWANPAMGLGAANMNAIGTEWVDIKSQFLKEVRCSTPWVPVHVNNGHECLMVVCTSPILDPVTAPFEPRIDRHVGQRNITVLQGQAGEVLPFRVELNNIFAVPTKTFAYANAQHISAKAEVIEKLGSPDLVNALTAFGSPILTPHEMLNRLRPGTAEYRNARIASRLAKSGVKENPWPDANFVMLRSAPRIASEISEARTQLVSPLAAETSLKKLSAARESLAFEHRAPPPEFLTLQAISMEPLESRHLELELGVPSSAKPGDFIKFGFEQWAENIPLGGYTVIIKVVDEKQPKRG